MAFYVSLGLNIAFVLFLVIGIIWGVIRGLKKSSARLLIFSIFALIGVLLTPVVTNAVLNIHTTIAGTSGTINQIIEQKLIEIPEVANLLVASPSLSSVVAKIPGILGNLVVFILMFLLSWLVGLIVYEILSATVLKNKKAKKGQVQIAQVSGASIAAEPVSKKKHRLLGGLVGAVEGFLFMFVFMIPINGIIRTFNDVANEAVVMAEESQESAVNQLLKKYIPLDVYESLISAGKTPIVAVGSFGALGDLCFDALTSFDVGGEKFVLRSELNTVAKIYNDVEYLFSLDFSSGNFKFSSLNFNKLDNAIDSLFDSSLYRMLAPELASFYLNEYSNKVNVPVDYKEFVSELLSTMSKKIGEASGGANTLKSDIKSVYSIFKNFSKSGLIDKIIEDKNIVNVSEYLNILTKNNNATVRETVEALFDSETIKSSLVLAVNFGLELMEKSFGLTAPIGRIDETKVDFNSLKQDSLYFTSNILDAFKTLDNNGYNVDNIIKNKAYSTIVVQLFNSLEIIKDSKIFKATTDNSNLFESLMNALNTSSYGKYYDFTCLNAANSIGSQGELFVGVLDFASEVYKGINKTKAFSEIEYSLYKQSITNFSDSQLLKGIKPELIDLIQTKIGTNEYVEALFNSIDKTNLSKSLKEILNSTLSLADVFGSSGALDQIINGKIYIYDLVQGIKNVGQVKFDEVIDSTFNLPVVQSLLTNILNSYIDNFNAAQNTTIKHVAANYTNFSADMKNVMASLLNLGDEFLKLDSVKLSKNALFVLEADTDIVLTNLAQAFDIIFNLDAFKDTDGNSVLKQILANKVSADFANIDFKSAILSLKTPFKMLQQTNILSQFNDTLGYELTKERTPALLEFLLKSIDGSSITFEGILKPFIDIDYINNNYIIPVFEDLKTNAMLASIIDFDILLDKTQFVQELNILGDALKVLSTREIVISGVSQSYLKYMLTQNADFELIITSMTYDGADSDVEAIFTPILSSKVFKPLLNYAFSTISTTVNIEGLTFPDVKNIDLTSQQTEIIDVLKGFLSIYSDVKQFGFDYDKLDKTKLASVMNLLVNNAYRDVINPSSQEGIFKAPYNAFLNYFKNLPNVGARTTAVLNEYINAYDVDFVNLIGLVDAINVSGGTFTADVKEYLLLIVSDMKSNSDVTNVTAEILKAAEVIMSIQGDLTPLKELNTNLEPYRTKMIGSVNAVDYTIDMLVNVTGFNELNILKELNTLTLVADIVTSGATQQNLTELIDNVKTQISENPETIEQALTKVSEGNVTIAVPEEIKAAVTTKLEEITNVNIKNSLKTILGII